MPADDPLSQPGRASLAPEVGALFEYNGRSYRCKGWLRPADPPKPGPDWADVLDELLYDSA